MGGMALGECKNRERNFCITQTNYKHYEGGYGRLPLGNVYKWNAMDFLQEGASLKKLVPKHFFTNLLKDLSIEDSITQ
jgi:hypothetical protein